MTTPRYLTKSRFKLGMECPTKLFYTGNPLYPDKSIDDPFLLALADGGFQVGELAKQYMTEYERQAIKGGLKKYCELDTMAMVMIYEAWMDWLQ